MTATPSRAREASRSCEASAAMSDADLCRAWRRSTRSLRDTTPAVDRLSVVEDRQRILDALESHHPREGLERPLADDDDRPRAA